MAAAPASSLLLLFCATAIAPLGLNVIVPALPAIGAAFETPQSTVQLTLSLYLLTYALAQLLLGPLSDRFGRRPVLLCATGLFVAASIWAALAPDFGVLMVARVLQALGGCAALVVPRAAVRDAHLGPDALRAMSRVTLAVAVMPALAPLLGGMLIGAWGWRTVFLACAVYGAVLWVWLWLCFAETLPPARRTGSNLRGTLRGQAALLRCPAYVAYAANLALLGVGFMAFISIAPALLIGRLGASPAGYGACQLLLGAAVVGGGLATPAAARRFGADGALLLASLVAAAGLGVVLALAGTLSVPRLLGPMLLYALASGVCLPLALNGAVGVAAHAAGAAAALAGFCQMGAGAAAVFAINQFGSAVAPFAACSLGSALAGAAMLALVRRPRPRRIA